jgi:predicted nucleic acid-binding protein
MLDAPETRELSCPTCGTIADPGGSVVFCRKCGTQVAPRSPGARPFVLDSNACDVIVDTPAVAQAVVEACSAGRIELLMTHVQYDELMEDEKRRERTLGLPLVVTPTYGVVVGTSKVGMAQLAEPDDIEAFRSPGGGHTADALIASTARYRGAVLVTNDKRLRNFAQRQSIEVWSPVEFVEFVARSDRIQRDPAASPCSPNGGTLPGRA